MKKRKSVLPLCMTTWMVMDGKSKLWYVFYFCITYSPIHNTYTNGHIKCNIITKGSESYYVDSGLQTFVNHGCNGSFNVAGLPSKANQELTEQNAQESDQYLFKKEELDWNIFDPHRLRHLHHYSSSFDYALQDINAGDEILADYLDFSEGADWWAEVQELRNICNGEGVGYITKKEQSHSKVTEN